MDRTSAPTRSGAHISPRRRQNVAESGEIVIQTRKHRRGWLMITHAAPFHTGIYVPLRTILNTGRPQSVVSVSVASMLIMAGVAEQQTVRQLLLTGVRVEGQPLPAFQVRASAGPALMGVDGML